MLYVSLCCQTQEISHMVRCFAELKMDLAYTEVPLISVDIFITVQTTQTVEKILLNL